MHFCVNYSIGNMVYRLYKVFGGGIAVQHLLGSCSAFKFAEPQYQLEGVDAALSLVSSFLIVLCFL